MTTNGDSAERYKKMGMFQRFSVERSDGKPLDQEEKHFTLRYDKDDPWGAAARKALKVFAADVRKIGYEPFAEDLLAEIAQVEERHQQTRQESQEQEYSPAPVPSL
jgi:hypothetical protein